MRINLEPGTAIDSLAGKFARASPGPVGAFWSIQ
jgi:hypothetical protein